MKSLLALICTCCSFLLMAQTAEIKGQLQDSDGEAVIYANVALYNAKDSTLVKVETTDETGVFRVQGLTAGTYNLAASYVGAEDLKMNNLLLTANQVLDLGVISFANTAIELAEATVTASRVMVEVKPDRTIFNVEGTINSVGGDAISLLRKAPGVTVDNNDNINVLGRAGVLLYVDGKRLPLQGADLTAYLQNLPAEQIDRFEIITNPGAKYEAEGNAGIIDIRLKKDKNLGANGSVSSTYTQGQLGRLNGSASGNFRSKKMNVFATMGGYNGERFNNMNLLSIQNGIQLDATNRMTNERTNYNYRFGSDFFLNDQHTLGLLVSGNNSKGTHLDLNRTTISSQATPTVIDSILVSDNRSEVENMGNTYNLNYRFDNRNGRSLNVDLDYGAYKNDSDRYQPNTYYNADETEVLTGTINTFETPTDIQIYTFKLDYEEELLGGKLGLGTKLSMVNSDNTFLVNNVLSDVPVRDNSLSNIFTYDENVYAAYMSFNRAINDKWSFSAGLRTEQTDATGMLQAFEENREEPPVVLDYLQWFPSAGLTWQVTPTNTLSLNYGRRINRPDYNVLNPFNNQLSELTYEKGNPFLRPEVVNNLELGYTLKYRYNFKLGYSRTLDQITRLIVPDELDERASFITWENLASQTIYSFNASLPFQVMEGWSSYFNFSAAYQDNQADYGDGAVVDIQAFTYSIYQQQTIDLPAGFKGEVSGYFSGPGVWGGVLKYESSWSLDIGVQKKFLNDALNVRLAANDLFYQTGWDGVSVFDGLTSRGGGNWDSRFVSLSLNYSFGNQNVKSRRRKTGLEEEAKRLNN